MRPWLTSLPLLLGFGLAPLPAFAQCTAPNVLVNGKTADADEVMENFDAVANCINEAVTKTGTAQSGAIAVFTGSATLSSGNLSGDVTTSGGTATTLTATGVTAGSYSVSDITVDAKGRITAIASGSIPSGANKSWIELSLANTDAETGDTTGWTLEGGGFTAETSAVSGHTLTPFEGSYSFVAASNANPKMYQTIDLSSYATDIDAGNLYALMQAHSVDTYGTGEHPHVYLQFFDASSNPVGLVFSGAQAKNFGTINWRIISAEGQVPPSARSMRAYLWADRTDGTNNNVAFELARAFVWVD